MFGWLLFKVVKKYKEDWRGKKKELTPFLVLQRNELKQKRRRVT